MSESKDKNIDDIKARLGIAKPAPQVAEAEASSLASRPVVSYAPKPSGPVVIAAGELDPALLEVTRGKKQRLWVTLAICALAFGSTGYMLGKAFSLRAFANSKIIDAERIRDAIDLHLMPHSDKKTIDRILQHKEEVIAAANQAQKAMTGNDLNLVRQVVAGFVKKCQEYAAVIDGKSVLQEDMKAVELVPPVVEFLSAVAALKEGTDDVVRAASLIQIIEQQEKSRAEQGTEKRFLIRRADKGGVTWATASALSQMREPAPAAADPATGAAAGFKVDVLEEGKEVGLSASTADVLTLDLGAEIRRSDQDVQTALLKRVVLHMIDLRELAEGVDYAPLREKLSQTADRPKYFVF